jgi:hypothetical protein
MIFLMAELELELERISVLEDVELEVELDVLELVLELVELDVDELVLELVELELVELLVELDDELDSRVGSCKCTVISAI